MVGKLGLSSWAYYWATSLLHSEQLGGMSAFELVERTAELGLEVVQLCETVPLTNWSADCLDQLRQFARERNVAIELGVRSLDPLVLCDHLEIAARLDARVLRIVPWSGSPTRELLQTSQLTHMVEPMIPICEARDISLAIENHFDIADQDLANWLTWLNHPWVGACLDTANSTGFLKEPLDTAKRLAPYVISVHLKDYVVQKQSKGYRISGVPLGKGWLDASAIMDAVRQGGRQPNVLLELWTDEGESPEATIAKEDAWVRESIAFARDQLGLGSSMQRSTKGVLSISGPR
jgi:3-oxoisoapionate decarboxylase